MARTIRNKGLETRSTRLKLKQGVLHWEKTGMKAVALGYRRGRRSSSWWLRYFDNNHNHYKHAVIGVPDDFQDADGQDVFDYFQAMTVAKNFIKKNGSAPTDFRVGDAVQEYLEWFRLNRRSYETTKRACDVHILPVLGDVKVVDLTPKKLRRWLNGLAEQPARLRSVRDKQNYRKENDERARKATANRVFSILRAALNRAWEDGLVATDEAWRRVKPFRHVDSPRTRYLSADECTRLINACQPDFRRLVQGALYTGCRYGELTATDVTDYNPDANTLHIRKTKNGMPRHIPLTVEGSQFFEFVIGGRTAGKIFLKADGKPWKSPQQFRRMKDACRIVKIEGASFHCLRDTYASHLVMQGVPLQAVAAVLGHADTRTTEKHYAHLAPSFVADVVRRNLPNLAGSITDTRLEKLTLQR